MPVVPAENNGVVTNSLDEGEEMPTSALLLLSAAEDDQAAARQQPPLIPTNPDYGRAFVEVHRYAGP